MTPAELATKYLLREAAAHAKPEGGNPRAILRRSGRGSGHDIRSGAGNRAGSHSEKEWVI